MSKNLVKGVNGYYMSWASEGSATDSIDWEEVWQYYQDNPLSTLQMPQTYGSGTAGAPYELCENNSGEWSGENNIGSIADESNIVNDGSYSIKASKSANESSQAVTQCVYDNDRQTKFYISDTSDFSAGSYVDVDITKFVYLSGFTNYPDGVYAISSLSTNSYISVNIGYRGDDTGTVYPVSALKWDGNDGYTDTYTNQEYFIAEPADTFKTAIRVSNSDIKFLGFMVGSEGDMYPNIFNQEETFTADTWTDVEIDLKSTGHIAYNRGRSWWHRNDVIRLFFISGSSGDIYADGVRFECQEPNIEKVAPRIYKHKLGIFFNGGYFKDNGYTIIYDGMGGGSSFGMGVTYYEMDALTLGDSNSEVGFTHIVSGWGESADEIFSVKSHTNDVYIYGMNVFANHGAYDYRDSNGNRKFYDLWENKPTGYVEFDATNGGIIHADDCKFVNVLDLNLDNSDSNAYLDLSNITTKNARYGLYNPSNVEYMQLNGFTYYGSYMWSDQGTFYGLKPVVNNAKFANQRRYYLSDDCLLRLRNMDFSEISGTESYYESYHYADDPTTDTANSEVYIEFELDLTVLDEDGNAIENANVSVDKEDGTNMFTDTTDSDGVSDGNYLPRFYSKNKYHGELYASDGISRLHLYVYPKESTSYGFIKTATTGGSVSDETLADYYEFENNDKMFLRVQKQGYESQTIPLINILEKQTLTVALKRSPFGRRV